MARALEVDEPEGHSLGHGCGHITVPLGLSLGGGQRGKPVTAESWRSWLVAAESRPGGLSGRDPEFVELHVGFGRITQTMASGPERGGAQCWGRSSVLS